MKYDVVNLFRKLRSKVQYDEDTHCILMLRVMADPDRGRLSAFCIEVGISDKTAYNWMKANELFLECYAFGKLMAKENWEDEGQKIREETSAIGSYNHKFEHWKMIGWSRFGVSQNPRIRLDVNPNATPNQHYQQVMLQASQGEFTAGQIKQLMEAVNIGLNAHQVETLQKEIDQLKADLITMTENSNGNNPFADKRVTKED